MFKFIVLSSSLFFIGI